MDLPPVGSPGLRTVPADTAPAVGDAASAGWRPAAGEVIAARVVQVLTGGAFLLETRGQTFTARSTLPLVPGQELQAEVTRTQPQIELRVLAPGDAAADRRAALLVLAGARQATPPARPTAAALAALAERLQAEMPAWPGHADLARLVERARPLPLDTDARALAAQVRALVGDAAPALEAALRRGAAPDADHVRALLAKVLAAIPPDADGTLAALGRALDAHLQASLGDTVETAWRHATDGGVRLDLPLRWAGDEGTAHLAVDVEGEAGADRERPGGAALGLWLEVPELGGIEARAQIRGDALGVQVYVEREATGHLLVRLQPAFEDRLRATGFPAPAVSIVVNPARIAAHAGRGTPPTPPGGSLLDVRA